jgi:hypothetical protein
MKSRGCGCGLPSPALDREDGLRPTVPSARDLSVLQGEAERVLQELYVPLTPSHRRRPDTRVRGGRAYAAGLVFLLRDPRNNVGRRQLLRGCCRGSPVGMISASDRRREATSSNRRTWSAYRLRISSRAAASTASAIGDIATLLYGSPFHDEVSCLLSGRLGQPGDRATAVVSRARVRPALAPGVRGHGWTGKESNLRTPPTIGPAQGGDASSVE